MADPLAPVEETSPAVVTFTLRQGGRLAFNVRSWFNAIELHGARDPHRHPVTVTLDVNEWPRLRSDIDALVENAAHG